MCRVAVTADADRLDLQGVAPPCVDSSVPEIHQRVAVKAFTDLAAASPIVATVRKVSVALLITIAVVAGCSGAAPPTVSTLNPQPTAASSAAPPSVVSPSLASPSLASPDGSVGDFKAYADSTLRPALNALS